jgi:acetyl-CoA C-acetyltransferase
MTFASALSPIGEQGGNLARTAVLTQLRRAVAGIQVERFCASGLEACNIAAAKVKSGEAGTRHRRRLRKHESRVMGSTGGSWASIVDRDEVLLHAAGVAADVVAANTASRADLDSFAVQSQQRAAKAWKEGRFKKSIVPVKDQLGVTLLDHDEHMRETTMRALPPSNPARCKAK